MFRKIEIWILYLVILSGVISSIAFGILVRQELVGEQKFGLVSKTALFLAEIPMTIQRMRQLSTASDHMATENRFPEITGFVGEPLQEEAYLLFSRFDGNLHEGLVELVDLRTFEILHTWNPDFDEINDAIDVPNPEFENIHRDKHDGRTMITHPLLTHDGSLIFQDYTPLRKINKCSQLIWQNQEERFHHSNEQDHEGNLWIPTHMYPYAISAEKVGDDVENYLDDAITKVSPDGKILFQKSVSELFIENDMEYLLFAVGDRVFDFDPIHLNDIEPVLSDGKYWEQGDVFISLRHQSMIILYRPKTNKILWVGTGHFNHQHDVNIVDDHRISIFENNSKIFFGGQSVDGYNKVVIYDFETNEYSNYLNDSLIANEVRTKTGGRALIMNNGDLLIEEHNFGRTIYFNSDGSIKWQNVNRAENGYIYILDSSRMLYTPSDIAKVRSLLSQSGCHND